MTHAQLQKELEESDLIFLAKLFDDPSLYFDQFSLNRAEQANIKKSADKGDIQEAMRNCLHLWRRMNPLEATFGKLLKIVLCHRRGDIVLEICEYISSQE